MVAARAGEEAGITLWNQTEKTRTLVDDWPAVYLVLLCFWNGTQTTFLWASRSSTITGLLMICGNVAARELCLPTAPTLSASLSSSSALRSSRSSLIRIKVCHSSWSSWVGPGYANFSLTSIPSIRRLIMPCSGAVGSITKNCHYVARVRLDPRCQGLERRKGKCRSPLIPVPVLHWPRLSALLNSTEPEGATQHGRYCPQFLPPNITTASQIGEVWLQYLGCLCPRACPLFRWTMESLSWTEDTLLSTPCDPAHCSPANRPRSDACTCHVDSANAGFASRFFQHLIPESSHAGMAIMADQLVLTINECGNWRPSRAAVCVSSPLPPTPPPSPSPGERQEPKPRPPDRRRLSPQAGYSWKTFGNERHIWWRNRRTMTDIYNDVSKLLYNDSSSPIVHHSSLFLYHSPSIVLRSPSIVHQLSLFVHYSPSIVHQSSPIVHHSSAQLLIWPPPFTIRYYSFIIRPS